MLDTDADDPASVAAARARQACGAADVTVLLPTYNRCDLLGESIRSILGQTCPPGEIIVIDDGSTDATAQVVASFGDRLRYLRKDNGGKATALNFGMAAAGGALILVMDDDDLLPPTAIENHVRALRDAPGADFSYGRYSRFSGDGANAPQSQDLEDVRLDDDRRLIIRLMERCFLPNPTWMARRVALDRAGPYWSALQRGQDFDMILRLAHHDDGIFVNDVVLWQRHHVALRGPATERVMTDLTIDLWLHYDRIIIDRFDDEWSDMDFAPYRVGGAGDPQLSGHHHSKVDSIVRLAVLQRATILFLHKSYDRAMVHFHRYRDLLGDQAPSRAAQFAASHLLGNRYSVDDLIGDAGQAIAEQLRALRLPLVLRRAFAKQLRWRVRKAMRAGDWRRVVAYLAFGRRAFGWLPLASLTFVSTGRGLPPREEDHR